MEDKDTEQKLKESADNIKVKPFSEKWRDMNADTGGNGAAIRRLYRFLPALGAVCVALIAAVVLPLALNKAQPEQIRYFETSELRQVQTDGTDFYEKTEIIGLTYSNFSTLGADDFYLLLSPDDAVKGGQAHFTGNTYVGDMVFYTKDVRTALQIWDEFSTCSAGVVEITYCTTGQDGVYFTEAQATGTELNYFITYTSLEDDAFSFFSSLFEGNT